MNRLKTYRKSDIICIKLGSYRKARSGRTSDNMRGSSAMPQSNFSMHMKMSNVAMDVLKTSFNFDMCWRNKVV
ncbi:hypothetical protein M8C21_014375 [Ambrosia artemisiifolia]|uniref:Uncharacterized protein n=1 Tax=Ambrosia artemisiifolia TaxID=4212 RepID=A0AAD5GQ23_AMBAR|nr:hypothetical protein M8C21_014375 [Ambrosia artemisiifolia]